MIKIDFRTMSGIKKLIGKTARNRFKKRSFPHPPQKKNTVFSENRKCKTNLRYENKYTYNFHVMRSKLTLGYARN